MLVTSAALILLAARAQKNGSGPENARAAIHTHIFRADGRAADGASFYLIAYADAFGQFLAEKGRTNSNGEVSLSHLKKKGETMEALVVRCPGQALFYETATGVPSEIHLTSGVSASLDIVLPNGAPAENLLVVPKILVSRKENGRPDFLSFPAKLASDFAVRTDAAGKCMFVDMPAGKKLGFDVVDDRFDQIGYQDQVDLREGMKNFKQLKLKPGASVSGYLTRDGRPVPKVVVSAQSLGAGGGWGSAKTDGQGGFKINRLGPGTYNVALDLKPPISNLWTGRAEEVSVQLGEAKTGLKMKLEKGAVIVGRVVNELGRPEKDIWIGIYGPAHPQTSGWVQSVQTDSGGLYRMRVPAGEQRVYVMNAGGKSKTLTIADGKTATVDFKIPTPGKDVTIVGHIKNEKGEPVSKAIVDVLFTGPDPSLGLQQITSDSSGRFSIVKPAEATEASILAHTSTLGTSAAVIAKAGLDLTVTVRPHQMASASGIVLDPTGKSIPGAGITVFISAGESGLQAINTKSGPDGRFDIKSLYPAREYGFWVTAHGFGEAHLDRLTPLPGEVLHLKQFRLPRADSYLVGFVKDVHGAIVPGATVGIEDIRVPPVTTDAAGRFLFDRIPRGSHRIYVERGSMHVDGQLLAGRQGQVVVLKPLPNDGTPVVEFGSEEPSLTFKLGSPALELETKTWVNSKPLKISQLRGKIVVLDFWGIWCRPCVDALPAVEQLAKTFRDKQVVVIGIHDSDGLPREMAEFAKKKGLTYALTIDRRTTIQSAGLTATKYRVMGFPSLVVIDKTGKVVGTPDTPERATEMIKHLLK